MQNTIFDTMKYIILHCLSFLLISNIEAQITISSSDMPQTNVPYPRSTSDIFDSLDIDGGENHTWDYSTLTSTGYDTIIYVSVSNAPFTYQLLFNNIFIQEYYADHARHTDDFSIPLVADFTNNFEFYQNNSEDYRKLGQGSSINEFPSVSQNDPIDIIYRFPMEFGNIDSSYSELDMNVPGLLFFHQEINRYNYVDGWGTLELPLATYDVLRVRTELFEDDSVHIEVPIAFGLNIPLPDQVEYKWFAQGEGIPILTVTETGGVISNISFIDSIAPQPIDTTIDTINVSVQEINFNNIKMYPNPVQNELTITGIDFQNTQSISIVDMQGKIVYSTSGIISDVFIINTSDLAPGQYILQISSDLSIGRRSLIKVE